MALPAHPWTLFLIDDHPVVGAGFELAALRSTLFDWVGEAPNLSAATSRLDETEPDVLILDLVINDTIGVPSISECRATWPKTHVVVFSSMPAELYAQACIAAGALTYCAKSDSPRQVLADVAEALQGVIKPYAPPTALRNQSLSHLLQSIDLTPREIDLLPFLAKGRSAAEIAEYFGKSTKTISAQRDTIRRKLGCRSTREMTALLSQLLAQRP